MCGVLIKEENLPKLKSIGVKDSKLLTKQKREELFNQIISLVERYSIEQLSPEKIDYALNDPNSNLNWVEADTSAIIINILKPNKAIVDCPSVNISSYRNYLVSKLSCSGDMELILEHKADLNHVVVGAASILAKVTRDREIEKLKNKFKVDFGSGYLSDEKTQEFLKNNYQNKLYHSLFRKTWLPFQKLINNKSQKQLGEF